MSSANLRTRHPAPLRAWLRFDAYAIVPIVGPIVLLATGSADFMFDAAGLVDSFGMVGRFWHYPDHNPLFEEYKGSRLPWILPGFFLHALFDEVTASYILHTTVLVGSSLALYLLLREAFHDRLTAAITAAAWSCYTWMHGQGGWNYHVYAASAYYVGSLWMFVRSTAPPRSRLWLVGAGVMLISAIHTHIVFAGFAPIAALLYLPALNAPARRDRWREAAVAGAYVSLGAVAATILLGAIDVLSGGSWLFFMPQIEYALFFAREGNRWLQAPMAWIPVSRHVVIPCVIVIAGSAWLLGGLRQRRPTAREWRFRHILVLQGVLAFALMLCLQFGARQTVFDYPYVTVPLFCQVFPMLGALLWQGQRRDGPRAMLLAVAAAVLMVAPLLVLLPTWLPERIPALVSALRLPNSPIVLAPFIVAVAILLCSIDGRGRLLIFVLGYSVMNAWLAAPLSYGFRTSGINRDMFVVFHSLDRFTATVDPSLFAVRYWGEPGNVAGVEMTHVFNSFAAIRRRSLVTAAYDRPGTRAEDLTEADLYSSQCLGVFSTTAGHNDAVNRIVRRFSHVGIQFRPLAHHRAESGQVAISVTILTRRPADDPRPGLLPCPPLP